MKSLNQRFKEYFSFTKGELISILSLLILIVLILTVPLIISSFSRERKAEFAETDSKLLAFNSKVNDWQASGISQNIKSKSEKQKPGKDFKKYKEDAFTVELNAADSLELMRLRGIGPAFAKKIMGYRKLLGGYCNKEQLLEVWGMDRERYEMIKEHIVVQRDSIHKININTAAFKLMLKHPYIKYELARIIINYRKLHGNFSNIDELKTAGKLNDSIYNKLKDYVKVR